MRRAGALRREARDRHEAVALAQAAAVVREALRRKAIARARARSAEDMRGEVRSSPIAALSGAIFAALRRLAWTPSRPSARTA